MFMFRLISLAFGVQGPKLQWMMAEDETESALHEDDVILSAT